MKIIIFGAAGGIGRHAVKHALARGYQVTAYLRDKNKLNVPDKNLRIVEGEISDYTSVRKALEDQDAVIWCVGIPLKRKYEKNAVSGRASGFGQGHESGRRKTACGLGYAKRSI